MFIVICGLRLFATGCQVATFGLTASICILVACMVFQRKTDFEFDRGVVLKPDDILSRQHQFLHLLISRL